MPDGEAALAAKVAVLETQLKKALQELQAAQARQADLPPQAWPPPDSPVRVDTVRVVQGPRDVTLYYTKNPLKTIHPNFILYSAPILPYTRLGYATHHCFLGFINPCVLPAPDTKTPQAFYSSSKRNTNNLILLLVLHPKCLQRYYATLLQILQYHF